MRLFREDSAVLLIDVQDKVVPAMDKKEEVIAASVKFIKGLRILDVPIIPVRMYPKGLGDLVPEIKNALGEHTPFDKTTFSACDNDAIMDKVRELGKNNLFVFGTEAHVCVLQTIVGLLDAGYNTIMVCDCVASRFPYDKEMGIRRAEREGAYPTTSESALFELLRYSGTDTFKAISNLVK